MLSELPPSQIIEAILILPFVIMGLSHIVQPAMWEECFKHLHEMGQKGVIFKIFMLELVPAIVIVTFHQVWSGWPIIITLYGCILMAKISISLLVPSIGLRSLAMAEKHGAKGVRTAGVILIALAGLCFMMLA